MPDPATPTTTAVADTVDWGELCAIAAAEARRRTRNREWVEELTAAGNLAAFEAARSWDPAKGPLTAWARLHVRAAQLRCLHALSASMLSRHDFEAAPNVRASAATGATPAEIAERCNVPVEAVRRILDDPRRGPLDDTDPTTSRSDHDHDPDGDATVIDLRPEATTAPRDWLVWLRHSGADGGPPRSLRDLAGEFGESKENLRRRLRRVHPALADRYRNRS